MPSGFARVIRAVTYGAALALPGPAAPAADCRVEPTAAGPVARVTDGRTLVLADGRTVRLAMIEVPAMPPPSGSATERQASAARASSAALAGLVAGNDIALAASGTDRYGRVLARAYVARNGAWRPVEIDLVAAGQAFVSPYADNQNCAGDLIAAERRARVGKVGLWDDPYYAAREADDPAAVLAALGRFAEGRVVSVRESGGTVYLNFGRRWSEDFTVTISKRNERSFAEHGVVPKALAGRRVRIRGVIEERGGPWIEVVAPGQIEIADR
jgi:endonuclease YncB( thermonuclease family)